MTFDPTSCWGHRCDSTQGSLCPSPMGIHQCMWIQWSIWQKLPHTYTYYILHTTYRISDHIVSFWTTFRRDNKMTPNMTFFCNLAECSINLNICNSFTCNPPLRWSCTRNQANLDLLMKTTFCMFWSMSRTDGPNKIWMPFLCITVCFEIFFFFILIFIFIKLF